MGPYDTRIHEIVTIPDGKWQQYEGPQMGSKQHLFVCPSSLLNQFNFIKFNYMHLQDTHLPAFKKLLGKDTENW